MRNGPTTHIIDFGGVENHLELETTKPLRTKELYVSSILPSFSSNDDTHTEPGSSHGSKSVYSEGSRRSQGSHHSLSTNPGSPQSQPTSQGSKPSNRSDSNNSDTNSKNDNTLEPAEDGFSIRA